MDLYIDLAGKLNIYERHIHENEINLHGAAALNKELSTAEGRGRYLMEQEMFKFIVGYSDYYREELEILSLEGIYKVYLQFKILTT
ncbi:hypothetical protein M4D55_07665 [Metabacillus idriensis]|uniref:hypothetical protein n=1 Tax=Metabacillus idriensis TaxID=324768 RepID=UPI00203B460D|nr:hypothetical protein [Metabacillus idriensis]MCM3595654.1 hypothetical protein [Metabacillus idriensis]